MQNVPYDWADDDLFAASPVEPPSVYESISETTRRGLWVDQSRRILDEAIALVNAGDLDKAHEVISVFVTRFNRRFGSAHTCDELRLP
jgi:hypothetical protein